jgi:hypothetical protein
MHRQEQQAISSRTYSVMMILKEYLTAILRYGIRILVGYFKAKKWDERIY